MYRAFAPFFEGATGATRVPPRQPSASMERNREKAAAERERLVDARILEKIRAITAYFLLLGSCSSSTAGKRHSRCSSLVAPVAPSTTVFLWFAEASADIPPLRQISQCPRVSISTTPYYIIIIGGKYALTSKFSANFFGRFGYLSYLCSGVCLHGQTAHVPQGHSDAGMVATPRHRGQCHLRSIAGNGSRARWQRKYQGISPFILCMET